MLISIDDYYDIDFYNDALMALEENGVQYSEHILFQNSSIPKYCLNLPSAPLMVHYNSLLPEEEKYLVSKEEMLNQITVMLVSKVIPIDANSSVELYRKHGDFGKGIRKEIYLNDAFLSIENYAAFINISSKEEALKLSKDIPLKIWYLGKYFNKYKVCLITSDYFIPALKESQILLEKTEKMSIVRFEQEFNFSVLHRKDRLIKYSKTPYFEGGIFYKPKNLTNNKMVTF